MSAKVCTFTVFKIKYKHSFSCAKVQQKIQKSKRKKIFL